jgi:hypothetical protein
VILVCAKDSCYGTTAIVVMVVGGKEGTREVSTSCMAGYNVCSLETCGSHRVWRLDGWMAEFADKGKDIGAQDMGEQNDIFALARVVDCKEVDLKWLKSPRVTNVRIDHVGDFGKETLTFEGSSLGS